MAHVIAIENQKGGIGKSSVSANLGIGLARQGKRVALLDLDPQASLTISLGIERPDELETTLAHLMEKVVQDVPVSPGEGILHLKEGVDLVPGNIELAGLEVSLVNAMSRETVLRQYLATIRDQYEYILIDNQPSLGMLPINALAAADSVMIPVLAQFLPIKGLEQLLKTIAQVRRQINPGLKIDGILFTMVDARTNFAKEIMVLLRNSYTGRIRIFEQNIPFSVRAAEATAVGQSIYTYDPQGKVAAAYEALTQEVLKMRERQHNRERTGPERS
ncbi:MAG: ParA family protein [Ethanoligenens sp.]